MEEDFYINFFGHRSMKPLPMRTRPLHPLSKFIIDNDYTVRKYVEENDDGITEWSDLVDEGQNLLREQDVQGFIDLQIIAANESIRLIDNELRAKRRRISRPEKVDKRKETISNYHLITFTYDSEVDTEESVKPKMDKFEQSKFKNYKYVCTEEKHSADNERYHRHYIVECTNRQAHTQNGLKRNPGHYYTGNINSKPIKMTAVDLERVMKYLHKENNPRGDVDYFRQKFAELFSKVKV